MDNEYEWGPWFVHDGNGCPCVGEFVHRVFDDEIDNIRGVDVDPTRELISFCAITEIDSWNGNRYHELGIVPQVIRYRIRKHRSKAMDILRAICLAPDTPINAPTGPLRELTPA